MNKTCRTHGDEGGYATVTAIILCAGISVLCAAILGVTLTQKRLADRRLFQAQQSEAINTAVLDFSTELLRAQGDATVSKEEAVSWPGGRLTVKLRAEYEGRKWPLAKLDEVDETILSKYTTLSRKILRQAASSTNANALIPAKDCLRTLFSSYGYADPKKELPEGMGVIAGAGGHDGQVWRITATTANVTEERYVRFTGNSSRVFAIITQDTMGGAVLSDCQAATITH